MEQNIWTSTYYLNSHRADFQTLPYRAFPAFFNRRKIENQFGVDILKTECIYRKKPKIFDEANRMIEDYIFFYNNHRIQIKTAMAPRSLRHSA